jgi:hypothetical protein
MDFALLPILYSRQAIEWFSTQTRRSFTLPRWLQNDVIQKWSIIGKAIWFTYVTNPSFCYQQKKKIVITKLQKGNRWLSQNPNVSISNIMLNEHNENKACG